MKFIKTPADKQGEIRYLNTAQIVGFKEYTNGADTNPWLDVYLNVSPPSTTPHKLTFIGVTAERFHLLCV